MWRMFFLLSVVILMGLSVPGAVHAESNACAQVGGTFMINFIDQTTALAVLSGDLQGAVRGTILKSEPSANGVLNLTTQHAILTATGDLLNTADQSVLTPISDKMYFMTQTQTITGGTGRFASATGTIKEFGAVDMGTGQGVLRYAGQLCTKGA